MNDFQKKYLLKRQDFGILYPYLTEDTVTDINWNGKQLWIDDLEKGKYMAADILPDEFVERLASLAAAVTNQVFNRFHPVMEAETEELRLRAMHRSVAHSGTAISLRKKPAVRRLVQSELVENGYCSETVHDFLKHCIEAHLSMVIGGLPGAGKTELLKYLTRFIPAAERVITVEDVLEIHYQRLNPNKDCVEMKVAENFSYGEAMGACLRQLPRWILLSEIHASGITPLMELISSGVSGLTTIHTEDVRDIPERIKNMAGSAGNPGMEDDIYRYLDVGILVKNVRGEGGDACRRIEQIAVFDRHGRGWEKAANEAVLLVEDGKLTDGRLPSNIQRRFRKAGIRDPLGGAS